MASRNKHTSYNNSTVLLPNQMISGWLDGVDWHFQWHWWLRNIQLLWLSLQQQFFVIQFCQMLDLSTYIYPLQQVMLYVTKFYTVQFTQRLILHTVI